MEGLNEVLNVIQRLERILVELSQRETGMKRHFLLLAASQLEGAYRMLRIGFE